MLSEMQFRQSMASPSTRSHQAFIGDQKVATVHSGIGTDWSPSSVSSLWVHPEYAGKGIGEALVQHVGQPMREGVAERNDAPYPKIPTTRFGRPKHA